MAVISPSALVQNQSVTILTSTLLSTGESTQIYSGTLLAASSEAAIPIPIDDKLGIIVSYGSSLGHQSISDTGGLVLTVAAGDGWRSTMGSFTVKMYEDSTTNHRKQVILGPFESAQFAANATSTARGVTVGDPYILLTVTTSTELVTANANQVTVQPFIFPRVSYST